MLQDQRNPNALTGISRSAPCSPMKQLLRTQSETFHVAHKVPMGDTPYVKAKRVQLVDKDPEKAIPLFWAAINAGDRVDSALKDMAIVMKQQNRAEEAIEAIKSLRIRCSDQAQESLDNILLDLFKRCGRLDDQIALLRHKLLLIEQGLAFNGKRTKTARSQGRKFQVSVEQEGTRLLGNLGWALMQQENYVEAELAYRRALMIGSDNNKMCNLGICLMKQGRIAEAKDTLKQVRPAVSDGLRGADSHLKAYERAQEMLGDLESKLQLGWDRFDPNCHFKAFLGSSSIWQPQPCIDHPMPQERFADENADVNRGGRGAKPELSSGNSLNVDAPPFYSRVLKDPNGLHHQLQDPLCNLKRTRSGNEAEKPVARAAAENAEGGPGSRMRFSPVEEAADRWPELPDVDEFNEAIMAAVLAPLREVQSRRSSNTSPALGEKKMGKRLRVLGDIF